MSLALFIGAAVTVVSRPANAPDQTETLAPGDITTFAGSIGEGPATSLGQIPYGVAVRGKFVYVLDGRKRVVRALDTETGLQTVVAGNGTSGFSGDGGPATSAKLNCLTGGVAVDSVGNLYIADFYNNRLRKVDTAGIITTIASDLFLPTGVTVDAADNVYVADRNNNRIVKVTPSGVQSTVAGGQPCAAGVLPCGDGGPATSAGLFHPNGVAVATDGSIYIADTLDFRIRKVDPSGIISTVAGTGSPDGTPGEGGPAVLAAIKYPYGVTLDGAGNLYLVDSDGHRIRKVDSSGIITTVAGNGTIGYSGDGGPATSAQIYGPAYTAFDAAGNLYFTDTGNYRIRKITPAGVITTVGGNGSLSFSGDGGPAAAAQLDFPEGVSVASDGSIYIADTGNNRVRKVDPFGVITTVAGRELAGFGGDGGPGAAAYINSPISVAAANGGVYIADFSNSRIRFVNSSGIITTVAGDGNFGFSGDGGPATSAQLNGPRGVAVGPDGSLYIGDNINHRIRKVDLAGIITTVAGSGIGGYSGDGGSATAAQISSPWNIAFDSARNLYFADAGNQRIRKVDGGGIISTVAGTGTYGSDGDGGPAVAAQLGGPLGVAFDAEDNLYIAEAGNNNLRKVAPSGIITRIAGNGTQDFGGDGGLASAAKFFQPIGIATDAVGNIYIADFVNARVRQIIGPIPVQLVGVASRKLHGGAGSFDIDLPVTGGPGIECRTGGASADYTVVFKFANTLTTVGGASVTGNSGGVSSSAIGADAHEYIVNLTGVTNAQAIIVSLTNVNDSAGNSSASVSASMSVLLGDTSGDGVVNSADITQTRRQSGQVPTAENFRTDITADGVTNSADITLVRRRSGTALPAPKPKSRTRASNYN